MTKMVSTSTLDPEDVVRVAYDELMDYRLAGTESLNPDDVISSISNIGIEFGCCPDDLPSGLTIILQRARQNRSDDTGKKPHVIGLQELIAEVRGNLVA